MTVIRSLYAIAISSLVATTQARHALLKADHHHKHEAIGVGKRQGDLSILTPPAQVPAHTTSTATVLTYITPSPGAQSAAVTRQSQIVTSFVPQYTICELPPLAFFSISAGSLSARPTSAPYMNYSISTPSGNGTCTTIYSPTRTMVCATTLTALVDKYTVSNCAQDITFSTQYGYVLVTPNPVPTSILNSVPSLPPNANPVPYVNGTSNATTIPNITLANGLVPRQASQASAMITPGPSIETLTTYFMAPWAQLTGGGTAPSEVDLKVCRTFAMNDTTECIREYQVWSTSMVTMTATSVTSINISTTIHGTSQVLVETFVANITEHLTTFSMSTTMDLEFQTEYTSTHTATRYSSTSTLPTVYETMTVQPASVATIASIASSGQDTTSTTTIHRTSTILVGTSTVTISLASPALPSAPTATSLPSTSVDYASMLGIGRR